MGTVFVSYPTPITKIVKDTLGNIATFLSNTSFFQPQSLASKMEAFLKNPTDQIKTFYLPKVRNVKELEKAKTPEHANVLRVWNKLTKAGFSVIAKSTYPDGTGKVSISVHAPSRHIEHTL